MSSIFDPATFMDQGTTEAGSTQRLTIEPGEYPGVIDKADPKVITSNKTGKNHILLEVTWRLQAPDFEKAAGYAPTIRQSIFLDMNGNAPDMSKGKNIDLNKLREALGMNKAGQQFKFNMLLGAGPAKVMVKNVPDKKAPDVIRTEVVAVGKL